METIDDNVIERLHVVEDDESYTPLILAARRGRNEIVQVLLSSCDIDMEREGTVKFDSNIIEGATALWCATSAGHLDVVKTLVKSGANVNHPTRTNSTPLRAACFDGRLDIVKYLMDHGADVEVANKYNNTCLMIAAYHGYFHVVSFLLEKGANPNGKDRYGATALHHAAECGYVGIVKELLEYGAEFSKTDDGMSLLITAANWTRPTLVEYLVTRPEFSHKEKIEALELLGASYANHKDNYSLDSAYLYLHRAMKMRFIDPNDIVLKELCKPVPAYENWVECQTLDELEAIRYNQNALHMESLSIRERILGTNNPEVPLPVIFRGAVFADNAQFARCVELWLHALHMCQLNKVCVVKNLLRLAQLFSQMIHASVVLPISQVEEVLIACVVELERNREKIANPGPEDDVKKVKGEYDSNITTVLYILVILTKVMKKCTKSEEFRVHRIVSRLNKVRVSTSEGKSLLDLCLNKNTPVDNFHTEKVCKFPCEATAKLLIQCGADVKDMDQNKIARILSSAGNHRPRRLVTIRSSSRVESIRESGSEEPVSLSIRVRRRN